MNARKWFSLILMGLTGQLAWTIENMYFNVYLYNTITTDPGYIAFMVAASAVVATLTTLLMGALSDRLGRRKAFICVGYILWGLSTFAFGYISVDNAARLFPAANAVLTAAVIVVAMDCVMTFFGSTANDAAFNAYITDTVEPGMRGRVESALAVLPLVSMLLVFGLLDSLTQRGEWRTFFTIVGGLTSLSGVAGLFLLHDAPLKPNREPFLRGLLYGFRPSVIRQHKTLYLLFCTACCFAVSVQIFFPYLIIYLQNYLQMDNYTLVLGIALTLSSLISVLLGRFIDRFDKISVALVSMGVMLMGLVGMVFARGTAMVSAMGTVMMSGYMLATAAFSAKVRDHTPPDRAGFFQGVRMIFIVMLPMLIGPAVGAAVVSGRGATYVELGVTKTVPTPAIFAAAAAALLVTPIPILILKRRDKA